MKNSKFSEFKLLEYYLNNQMAKINWICCEYKYAIPY